MVSQEPKIEFLQNYNWKSQSLDAKVDGTPCPVKFDTEKHALLYCNSEGKWELLSDKPKDIDAFYRVVNKWIGLDDWIKEKKPEQKTQVIDRIAAMGLKEMPIGKVHSINDRISYKGDDYIWTSKGARRISKDGEISQYLPSDGTIETLFTCFYNPKEHHLVQKLSPKSDSTETKVETKQIQTSKVQERGNYHATPTNLSAGSFRVYVLYNGKVPLGQFYIKNGNVHKYSKYVPEVLTSLKSASDLSSAAVQTLLTASTSKHAPQAVAQKKVKQIKTASAPKTQLTAQQTCAEHNKKGPVTWGYALNLVGCVTADIADLLCVPFEVLKKEIESFGQIPDLLKAKDKPEELITEAKKYFKQKFTGPLAKELKVLGNELAEEKKKYANLYNAHYTPYSKLGTVEDLELIVAKTSKLEKAVEKLEKDLAGAKKEAHRAESVAYRNIAESFAKIYDIPLTDTMNTDDIISLVTQHISETREEINEYRALGSVEEVTEILANSVSGKALLPPPPPQQLQVHDSARIVKKLTAIPVDERIKCRSCGMKIIPTDVCPYCKTRVIPVQPAEQPKPRSFSEFVVSKPIQQAEPAKDTEQPKPRSFGELAVSKTPEKSKKRSFGEFAK